MDEFESLDAAMAAHNIPLENRPMIRQMCQAVDAQTFAGGQGYIKAERRGDGPALNIASGWTNGFRSTEEAEYALGDLLPSSRPAIRPSDRGKGQFFIAHPVNQLGSGGGGGSAHGERDYGVCQKCWMAMPATGVCLCDA